MLVTSKLEELRQRLIKLYKVFLKRALKVSMIYNLKFTRVCVGEGGAIWHHEAKRNI